MPSHYFYNRPKHFTGPVQTPPGDDVKAGARKMIRIFSPEAECVAFSQARKFASRGDEDGEQVWRNIGAAIGKARPR